MYTQHMKQVAIISRKGISARLMLRWYFGVYSTRMLEVSAGVEMSVPSLHHNHFRV
jgi:hypothetical protein